MAAVEMQAVLRHIFNGDQPMLAATADRRSDLRAALFALQQDICAGTHYAPVEVVAVVKIRVAGREVIPLVPTKEHVYTVTITDRAFDMEEFKSKKMTNQPITETMTAALTKEIANGISKSTKRKASESADIDDEVVEVGATKRTRIEANGSVAAEIASKAPVPAERGTQAHEETMTFLRDWRREWQSQGGWLFDTLNAAKTTHASADVARSHQLSTMQTVLNSALERDRAAAQRERASTQQTLLYIEKERTALAQKMETRENEWRSSSATFHDRSKTERQEVEARIEEKLARQERLLARIAKAGGISMEGDGPENDQGSPAESDGSLGAQLAAELEADASRAAEPSATGASAAED
ncbi:uncharacterized protein K489DRAFT_377758 [Dissoconium aciculare CBS 342.82]|uniref:Uncharacterized protein n=1 Tax=Dissoconium aciculare CBS 342.82 TaxID=1314786 RepID=A0A6J3MBG9_9PEZI|nr:uncharacterized protein K489DRAFT_377758 [Dissoconium aciculare CBS 342.82]KAF1825208.1 hypothetical protein K489DRAFT_377758 [Dissoconium aciculare CBS 342.82]